MINYYLRICFMLASLSVSLLLSSQGILHNDDFMSRFVRKSAIVTDYRYKDTIPSECALVRLDNGKIVVMTRQNGEMKPFYIKAIETGYWDTRYEKDIDYRRVFADMKETGANTAYVMIHWEDIEISDNRFDFTFTDTLESAARNNGMKLKWVLFFHAQFNGVPSHKCETAWTFHLDDRDSCNYTMQWPKKNGIIIKNIKELVDNDGIRPLHLYGHPEIFYRIKRMLYNLAVHYRNSDVVIGVQVGNEEGFSFLDESDYNPVTASLFEEWKLKTNKTDYAQFKKEAINWWWGQFTTAFHEGDPYKILSTNLDAGAAEAEDIKRIEMTGTSSSMYADGNLDAIGTMFYKGSGYKAILGLDKRYNEGNYNYELPILIPSEIGIGKFNTKADFTSFVMHTLERAGQGFGVYCYGEIREGLEDSTDNRALLSSIFSSISANEDIITEGLPGPGYTVCKIDNINFKVSHLHKSNGETLAVIYVPSLFEMESGSSLNSNNIDKVNVSLYFSEQGEYSVRVLKSGELYWEDILDGNEIIPISDVNKEDFIFIKTIKR